MPSTTDPDERATPAGSPAPACSCGGAAFDELGGFDDGYFMYFEDVDLGYRLSKAGYRNVYEPSEVVNHSGAHSTSVESERMIEAHHESARRFLQRKYPGPLLWPSGRRSVSGSGSDRRCSAAASARADSPLR